MRRLILLAGLFILTTGLRAQVPQNVIEIMQKCGQTLVDNTKGLQIDMDLKMSYLVFSMTGDMVMRTKGDKKLTTLHTKVLGRTIREESGCDGKQNWRYSAVTNGKGEKEEKDTLLITPLDQKMKKKNDVRLDLSIYMNYQKAVMKEKNGKYEITFTQPKKADSPKKMVALINKSNYQLIEMSTTEKGAAVRMTVKSIKVGVPDNVFELDLKKYPGATVVRKS